MHQNERMTAQGEIRRLTQQVAVLASQFCALLVEHHDGRAMVSIGTIEACQKTPLNLGFTVDAKKEHGLLTVFDAKTGAPLIPHEGDNAGKVLDVTGLPSVPAGTGAGPAQAVLPPPAEPAEVPPPRCTECDRVLPMHNMDCSQSAAA